MKPQAPILTLKEAEKHWLKEVYRRSLQGEQFTFRDIHSQLGKSLLKGLRPLTMDPRLVSSNGEQIRLLGLLALEGDTYALSEIDEVANYVGDRLLAEPKLDRVAVSDIAEATGLDPQRVSLLLQVMQPFGKFYTSAGSDAGSILYKYIMVSGSDAVYYQYLYYTSIVELIELQSMQEFRQPVESFSFEEMATMNEKIDQILKDLSSLKSGQEVIWTDFKKEFEELKAMYGLGKKNWGQIAIGKVAEMVFSGIISETVSKQVLEYLKPIISKLLESGGWLTHSHITE